MSNKTQDFRIIREMQVNTPSSLLTITPGTTVSVPCKEFAPWSTVKSAITRINQRMNRTEFSSTSPDNGATIVITRYN